MSWFDDNPYTGADPQADPQAAPQTATATTTTPPNYSGALSSIYDAWKQATGREPTNQEVMQWGTNIDPNYLQKIVSTIQNTPEAQAYAKSQQKPSSTVPPPPTAGTSDQDLVKAAVAKGLTGQAAVDWINSQKPDSAVVVQAGQASPAGKIVWYDKGGGSGKFQGTDANGAWEYKQDPALGPGWNFNTDFSGDSGGGGGSSSAYALAPPTATNYGTAGYQVPTYTLPTLDQIRATPGYQFAQEQGDLGIQRSAAAKGTLLSGGTLKDLAAYNQGLADTASQNAVGNSLNAFGANTSAGQFGANYGLAANQQGFGQNLATNQFNLGAQGQYWGQGLAQNQNAFNQYNTNQNTAFNQWLQTAQLSLDQQKALYG